MSRKNQRALIHQRETEKQRQVEADKAERLAIHMTTQEARWPRLRDKLARKPEGL